MQVKRGWGWGKAQQQQVGGYCHHHAIKLVLMGDIGRIPISSGPGLNWHGNGGQVSAIILLSENNQGEHPGAAGY